LWASRLVIQLLVFNRHARQSTPWCVVSITGTASGWSAAQHDAEQLALRRATPRCGVGYGVLAAGGGMPGLKWLPEAIIV
jgi:hypothetical protein